MLLLALGITLTLVAWGYLVLAAIEFGAAARSGDDQGWAFLALASAGAVACLFTTLILLARCYRLLTRGRTSGPSRHSASGTRSS